MSFALLKTADLYKTDETVKWYVDGGEKISKSIQSIFSGTTFAFRMTMLAGDIGFGTSDTFNRYQEMKIVSDIAGAIVEANRHVQTPSRYDSPNALSIIQTKCDYYKMLIVTHARGEYLVYQLLINDAGLLSDFRALFDAFKEPGETTESWYNGQIDVMLKYYDTLNSMFVIEDEEATTTNLGNVPQDAAEFNGHFYYVYNLDTVSTWNEAKQYCENLGGYLATITTPEENEFVYSYLKMNFGYESAYFGFTDQGEEGVWLWDNGEESSYTNWHSGEPNGENSNEDFAMFYYKYSDGTWNDGDFGQRTVNSGVVFICEWGEYNIDVNPSEENDYETDSALGKYLAAAAKTTETGSWSEQLSLEADMSIAYDGGKTKTKVTLAADSDISNYVEDDLSQIEITSLANMKVMGQTYAWSTEYYDGVAHYEYTEPFQRSESLDIPPDFFDFEASIPEEAILTEEVSGNQIRFIVSGEEMTETGIAAVQQMSGVNNLECEDVEVIVILNDSSGIDKIQMNFDASVEYQGYDADVTYKIQYTFN